jgi:DUF1680 family protein
MQETCVTVTLMKLLSKLLLLTGKAKYAEYIECSALNAMLGAVNDEGQRMSRTLVRTWREGGEVVYITEHESYPFDSYSPLYHDRRGKRCGGVQIIGEGRTCGCCVCIGSAGTAIAGLFQIMRGEGALYLNLYNDLRFTTEMGGERVRVDVRSNPYEGKDAIIKVQGSGARFTLALRVPSWAEGFAVSIDGERADGEMKDGYLLVDRIWSGSVTVKVRLGAKVRMRVINGKIAFTRGAITLARDTRLGDISAPVAITARDGKAVRARRVRNLAFGTNVAVEIPTRDGTITLCDYAKAGKNFDDENTGITVWQDKI